MQSGGAEREFSVIAVHIITKATFKVSVKTCLARVGGWGGGPGGAEMPVPTACLQSPEKQFRYEAVFGLAEQTRAALEDAVGTCRLSATVHPSPWSTAKCHALVRGHWFPLGKSQPTSADSLCTPTKAVNTSGGCVFILGCL